MIPSPRGSGRVVAGFDGSWHGRAAVERAGDEARERGLPLQVVMLAWTTPDPDLVPRAQRAQERRDLQEAAQHLADMVDEIRASRNAPRVWGTLVDEAERSRLAELLLGCRLLVVGDRGQRGRRAFVVGSASDEFRRATDCPVLVVPGGAAPGSPRGPVLVGIDDRPHAQRVLMVAADEAARRGGRLEVIHAYPGHGPDADDVVVAARHTCDHQVAAAQLRPDVVVTRVVTCEDPAAALLSRAYRASLLVVGTRGSLGLAGLVAGSVSRGVLAGARCPVLLVPSGHARPEGADPLREGVAEAARAAPADAS